MNSRHSKHVPGFQSGFTSYKAIAEWALPFVADQINLVALDKKIDAFMNQPGQSESLSDEVAVAIGILHSRYRISLARKSHILKGGSTETVQLWDPCGKKGSPQPPPNVKGRLYTIAAMVLMTFMYQARTVRYDVQKSIDFMARRISGI